MKHSPRKRQIFALLDGRLSPAAQTKLRGHLQECKICSAYHGQIEHLQGQALSAWPIGAPDWSSIDRAVESALREITSHPGRKPFPLIPLFLTLGAAAMVVVALMFPSSPQKPFREDIAPRITHIESSVRVVVTETILEEEPPKRSRALAASERVKTSEHQGVRLGIGSEASVEIGHDSSLGIITLSEYTPKIELLKGVVRLSVPESSALEHGGIEVLAGGAQFQVLYGVAEFSWRNDTLELNVASGKIDALAQEESRELDAGLWHYAPRPALTQSQRFTRIDPLSMDINGSFDTSLSPKERSLRRGKRGNLPKRVIRQVLAPVMPKLRGCYEQALKRDPQLTLTAGLRVTVNRTGKISQVTATGIGKQKQLKACFEEVTKDTLFPPPQGGSIEFILPLRLYPRL